MKKLTYLCLSIAGIALLYHLFNENLARLSLQRQHDALSASVSELLQSNAEIEEELEYLSDPYNLEKELREQNYKSPNEKVIIVAPAGN